jgi:eukaryotic-like serine/threonine-protein kinase
MKRTGAELGDAPGKSGSLSEPPDRHDLAANSTSTVDCAGVAERSEGPPGGDFANRQIGRFAVVRLLGAGGMGIVYEAYDPRLHRRVAVKVLRDGALSPRRTQRMMREAQALAQLSHPNVVNVYEVGTCEEGLFIAMQLVRGVTLKEWLAQRPRPWRQVLSLFMDIGAGLAAAHDAGLVHRDFKPSNAIVGDNGTGLVLDFGVARLTTEPSPVTGETTPSPRIAPSPPSCTESATSNLLDAPLTQPGRRIGTPSYMAPEQRIGHATSHSDQYSYCLALYQALYDPPSPSPVHQPRRRLARWRSTAPPRRLRPVIMRGLQPDPGQRHPSMHTLLVALRRRSEKRWRWLAVIAGVSIALLAFFAQRSAGELYAMPAQCDAAEPFAGVWTPARKAELRAWFARLASVHGWRHVEDALDRYVAQWQTMRAEACAATYISGLQSQEVFESRMLCLAQRRDEVRALLEQLAAPGARLLDDPTAIAQILTDIDTCANSAWLDRVVRAPADSVTKRQIDRANRAIAASKALLTAGKLPEGLARARTAVQLSAPLAYPPTHAAALLQLGIAHNRVGAYRVAVETLKQTLTIAERGHLPRIKAYAVIILAEITAEALHDLNAGDWWLGYAEAMLDAVEPNRRLAQLVQRSRGILAKLRGDYVAAEAHFERALALARELDGPESLAVADLLYYVGETLAPGIDGTRSLAYLQQARALTAHQLGPDHPRAALADINLAAAYLRAGEPGQARLALGRGATVLTRTLGPEHSQRWLVHSTRGVIAMHEGAYERAETEFGRALDLVRSGPQPSPLRVAAMMWSKAAALVHQKRFSEARPLLAQAHETWLEFSGAADPELPVLLLDLAEAEVEVGLRDHGLRHLERALELHEQQPHRDDRVVGLARFVRARWLWYQPGRRQEARSVAREARGFFAERGRRGAFIRRQIDRWLEERERR